MTSLVYFVRIAPEGPLKIGHTTGKVEKRIANLQCGCPWKLIVIGVVEGTSAHEHWMHRRFANLRMEGEWFEPRPKLFDAINAVLRPDFIWPTTERVSVRKVRAILDPIYVIRKNIFNFTQAEFAEVAKVSQSVVSRWEAGTLRPFLRDLEKIRNHAITNDITWDDRWFFEAPEMGGPAE